MRERQPRVQSSCEESIRIFSGRRQSVQEWCKAHECYYITERFQDFPASMSHSPVENLRTAFIFLLHERSKPQHWLYSNTEISYLCFYGDGMWPLPPNPCHPEHNDIFEGNWANQGWNVEELIIIQNLLSVTFYVKGFQQQISHSYKYPVHTSRWAVSS